MNPHANSGRRPVFDVNRNPDRNLPLLAKGLQSDKARRFHQPNHVGSRIDRRQFRMMRRQRVLQLDGLVRFADNTDGNVMGHTWDAVQEGRLQKPTRPSRDRQASLESHSDYSGRRATRSRKVA